MTRIMPATQPHELDCLTSFSILYRIIPPAQNLILTFSTTQRFYQHVNEQFYGRIRSITMNTERQQLLIIFCVMIICGLGRS